MYIYIYIHNGHIPMSVKKHSSGEEDLWEEQLPEHQIGGRIAVSAAGLQGKGSHKRSGFSDTGILSKEQLA